MSSRLVTGVVRSCGSMGVRSFSKYGVTVRSVTQTAAPPSVPSSVPPPVSPIVSSGTTSRFQNPGGQRNVNGNVDVHARLRELEQRMVGLEREREREMNDNLFHESVHKSSNRSSETGAYIVAGLIVVCTYGTYVLTMQRGL